jgi:hypothetical protein
MKLRFLILIMFLAVAAGVGVPQQTQGPLSKTQVMALVKAGMETPELVDLIRQHGIDFDLTDDYLQALGKAGAEEPVIQALRAARPTPLTKDQVLKIVAGHVPIERAVVLVTQRGIDFLADEEYLNTLRLAGADDTLITAVREASAAVTAELVVATSPNARVYLDGELHGQASAQGELVAKVKPGAHALKITLAGKKDFEQSITLTARQVTPVEAHLMDLTGSIRVRTLAGATISLDGASRGITDATGVLVLAGVAAGPHDLRVSVEGKKDFQQSVMVAVGEESAVNPTLADLGGTLHVQTLAGAEVFLDGSSRGTVDASGQLAIPELAAGSHDLRIAAHGRQEYRQSVSVIAGQESRVVATPEPLPMLRFQVEIEQGWMDESRRWGYLLVGNGRIKYENANDKGHEFDAPLSDVTDLRTGKVLNYPMLYFRVKGSQYKFSASQPENVRDAIARAMAEH